MRIYPSNNSGFEAGILFATYPENLGHMHNVLDPREPRPGIPWVIDNGAFTCWKKDIPYDEAAFYEYMDRYHDLDPEWVAVPDAVGNMDATLSMWQGHWPATAQYGVPMAFVVQDGMLPQHVPSLADLVFVGGSKAWKWRTVAMWCGYFPRVHVGRVNSIAGLRTCERYGVESVDGTGWFRHPDRTAELERYLKADPTPEQQLDLQFHGLLPEVTEQGYVHISA